MLFVTDDDPVSNEAPIATRIQKADISAFEKSRTISAIEKILGAAIDIPLAQLKTRAEVFRERKALRPKKETKALSALDVPQQGVMVERNLLDAINKREIRKILNKKEVVEQAINYLTLTGGRSDEPTGELSEDWLNYFESYAEKASTQEIQNLWGRVLYGEIRKPTTYTLEMLRVLSELDTHIVCIFNRIVKNRYKNTGIFIFETLEGNDLIDAMKLEEAGLLQDVSSGMRKTFARNSDKSFFIQYGKYLAILHSKDQDTLQLLQVKISKIGQELLGLHKPPPAIDVLSSLIEHWIRIGSISSGRIGEVTAKEGNNIHYNTLREWPEPAKPTNLLFLSSRNPSLGSPTRIGAASQ